MSDANTEVTCAICGALIQTDDAVFLPAAESKAAPLVLCRGCGDLDLAVDP